MIKAIRRYGIPGRGWILAAIIAAAAFTSTRVACLTHAHCIEEECFDPHEEPHHHGHHHHDHDYHGHDDLSGRECNSTPQCEEEDHDHDVHTHTHKGHVHPQRSFTAPVHDAQLPEAAGDYAPHIEPVRTVPGPGKQPPLERYGPVFVGRAPPLS